MAGRGLTCLTPRPALPALLPGRSGFPQLLPSLGLTSEQVDCFYAEIRGRNHLLTISIDDLPDDMGSSEEVRRLAVPPSEDAWAVTNEALRAAERELAWMIAELVQLPGVGGTGDCDTPESVMERARGALTKANNRARAWEWRAKTGQ